MCLGERSAQPKQPGPRTSHRVPDPQILSGPLSGEGTDTPSGGSGAATCPQAQARARPRSFPGKTRPPTAFNTGDVSALCHSIARGDFCQAVLLTARYQGAQCSLWHRPHHARQSVTPVRHDSSATEYHNAYAVDSTVYAATYTASTGASPLGQVKTPLGQRVYRAMKRIRKEIHKALLMSFS